MEAVGVEEPLQRGHLAVLSALMTLVAAAAGAGAVMMPLQNWEDLSLFLPHALSLHYSALSLERPFLVYFYLLFVLD